MEQDAKLIKCNFCGEFLANCICPDDEPEIDEPYDDSEPYRLENYGYDGSSFRY